VGSVWLKALVRLRVGNRSMNASPSKFPLACTCVVVFQSQCIDIAGV
jgi:hypothetical protein